MVHSITEWMGSQKHLSSPSRQIMAQIARRAMHGCYDLSGLQKSHCESMMACQKWPHVCEYAKNPRRGRRVTGRCNGDHLLKQGSHVVVGIVVDEGVSASM